MSEKIRALGKNILIEPTDYLLEDQVGEDLILIPKDKSKFNYKVGKVLSVAEDYFDGVKYVKHSVKEGDLILYKEESALKIEKNKFITPEHIFAIINKTEKPA